jgi:long-chain acyl-CoA synthetase
MAAIDKGYRALPGILRGILDPLRRLALKKAQEGNFQFGQKLFRFIRKKAGLHSLRIMVAGGGPLSPRTADFFDSLGFNIVHGYGTSENSPLISVNTPHHKRNYSVGLPVKHTDVKIVDLNEEGIGEILIKSPSVMLGYYQNQEATDEVIGPDGYLRTGDLGYRDDQGYIYINGRKKNLIVSSGGKNVYPEEVESHFEGSRVIGEILVMSRRDEDFGGEQVAAVVVPNWDALGEDNPGKVGEGSAEKAGGLVEDWIREAVKKEVERVNRELTGYKKITEFALRREPFEKNAQQKIRRFLYKDFPWPTRQRAP